MRSEKCLSNGAQVCGFRRTTCKHVQRTKEEEMLTMCASMEAVLGDAGTTLLVVVVSC